jgi:formylglycine-generating enzyme required for sulfatase activity
MRLSAKLLLLFGIVGITPWLASAGIVRAAPGASVGQRVALVIGNGSYRNVGRLDNARADAGAVAAALRDAGFDVNLGLDLDERALKAALRQFKTRVSGGDDAVFYYAGHAVEIGGANYLLPVDIVKGNSEDELKDGAIRLQRALDDLREQRSRFALTIVDACRDNPFRQTGRALGHSGLAPTAPASGQMVVYSAGAGQQALDRLDDRDSNPHSLFTRVLLEEMIRPGVPADQVFRRVREKVAQLAERVRHEQVPAIYDQTLGSFYFKPAREAAAAGATAPPNAGSSAATPSLPVALAAKPREMASPPPSEAGAAPAAGDSARQSVERSSADQSVERSSAPHSGTRRSFRDCPDCPEMVTLPAGRFAMGSALDIDARKAVEVPVHEVRVGPNIALARAPVTRREFSAFVDATGYLTDAERKLHGRGCRGSITPAARAEASMLTGWREPGFTQDDDHPVVCVSWNDAKAYTEWLSRSTGKRYRLPSEAEWEYATRAGSKAKRFWGDDPSDACEYANVADQRLSDALSDAAGHNANTCSDGYPYTAPVKRFKPNAFGLYDMLGNVGQWTDDCWHENYMGAPSDARAWGAENGGDCARHAVRGGGWSSSPGGVRSAVRVAASAVARSDNRGFRLVRDLP